MRLTGTDHGCEDVGERRERGVVAGPALAAVDCGAREPSADITGSVERDCVGRVRHNNGEVGEGDYERCRRERDEDVRWIEDREDADRDWMTTLGQI